MASTTESQIRFHETALSKLLERQQLEGKWGNDVYPEGTVLVFQRKFDMWEKTYHYAAVKAKGAWFVTGKRDTPFTWSEFVSWLQQGNYPVTELWWATDFELVEENS